MDPDELIRRHPQLFHMAAAGSWPAIRRSGLLSTRRLVEVCAAGDTVRDQVLGRRRATSVTLEHPVDGPVVVRDQGPLREHILRAVLTDLTVEQWLDILNGRVFLWPDPDRLDGLLRARRYRDHAHDVLVVDTASLLAAHAHRVRLSAINSGATLYPNATPRGSTTFRTIAEHDAPSSRRSGIAEVAVLDGVDDIAEHVVRVERRRQDTVLEVLDLRPCARPGGA